MANLDYPLKGYKKYLERYSNVNSENSRNQYCTYMRQVLEVFPEMSPNYLDLVNLFFKIDIPQVAITLVSELSERIERRKNNSTNLIDNSHIKPGNIISALARYKEYLLFLIQNKEYIALAEDYK